MSMTLCKHCQAVVHFSVSPYGCSKECKEAVQVREALTVPTWTFKFLLAPLPTDPAEGDIVTIEARAATEDAAISLAHRKLQDICPGDPAEHLLLARMKGLG